MIVLAAYSLEPEIQKGAHPEESFRTGFLHEVLEVLSALQKDGRIDEFFLLPDFGFDLGVFIGREGQTRSVFFNLKMYMGAKPRVVEIGDQNGSGPEIELLQLNTARSALAAESFRWILVDITKPRGNRRFSIFTTDQAKEGLMGGLNKKKQNSIKLASVMTFPMTWDELSGKLTDFLGN
ncbi:MAG: hypothetical protein XE01_0975 [Synergistales bacterium 58_81]|jgi:hypothetical protein|nr:MAG: hypothetical protein XD83_0566 [Synergistales bacterium 57_84]KUK86234.1 MAG: hypothetical protein XE01_0975 [Synergistales bacterium 58_81]HCR39034.1 hypothetical protein [Synergistaceae bacterium]